MIPRNFLRGACAHRLPAVRRCWSSLQAVLLMMLCGSVAIGWSGRVLGEPARALAGEETHKRPWPKLPPFLEVFTQRQQHTVTEQPVQWVSAVGTRSGLLFRVQQVPPSSGEGARRSALLAEVLAQAQRERRSPALLLIPDGQVPGARWRRAAGEFAEIGYVVLLVEVDEKTLAAARESGNPALRERVLAELTAALRWLRSRGEVSPERVGVVGWSVGGSWAVELAATMGLEACVNCMGPLRAEETLLAGLDHTAVMIVGGGSDRSWMDVFAGALQARGIEHHRVEFEAARDGFMFPENGPLYRYEDAEHVWFQMYEFLDEHVEDAARKGPLVASDHAPQAAPPPTASLAELMQAVNSPSGVRGALASLLNDEPNEQRWKQVRARAALLVEAGGLILQQQPPRGTPRSWRDHVDAYRSAARAIVVSAEVHDYSAALQALQVLNTRCAACHLDHR